MIYRIQVEEITDLMTKKMPNTFPTRKVCVGNALDFDIPSLLFSAGY